MKKIHLIGLAVAAVTVLGAFTAASASATQFLISGNTINTPVLVLAVGELHLQDSSSSGSLVLCSGVFDIDIVNSTLAEILALYMLSLNSNGEYELLDENGGTTGPNDMIDCVGTGGLTGCATSESNLLTLLGLPWHLDLELMTAGTANEYLIHFLTESEASGENNEAGEKYGEPTYDLECKTALGTVNDSCHGLTSARLENMPGEGVLAIFNPAAEPNVESEKGECTLGGAGSGELEGEGLMTEPNGLEVSVST